MKVMLQYMEWRKKCQKGMENIKFVVAFISNREYQQVKVTSLKEG